MQFKHVLIGCVVFVFLGVFAALIGLIWLGNNSPELHIYPGNQVPAEYKQTMRDLNVLSRDEDLIYFYSDAVTDITSGFYALSDKNLILYSDVWEDPGVVIPLGNIDDFDVIYDDSFWVDTQVTVYTTRGEYSFPLSSEMDRDRKFIEEMSKRMDAAKLGNSGTQSSSGSMGVEGDQ